MLVLFLACAAAAPTVPFRFEPVAEVEQPTAIAVPPGGPEALYVTEQAGRIWRVDPAGDAAARGPAPTLLLDLHERVVSGGERGLLGLAFAPGYPADPRLFVNYTYEDDKGLHTRVSSFQTDGLAADPASEVEVLTFDQPYANHNSGALAFGPDGMLYIGVGDGGSGGDPQNHAQDRADWLGSILRVDVRTAPYTVPADNPFVNVPGVKPEIWAYGVRNPWGMHFDGADLWFADVGQDEWEEVDRGVPGGNYGWRVMEGTHCYKAATCDATGFVAPIAEYGHDQGRSVTGGLVYRGPSIPGIDGRFVYADFVTGRFWAVDTSGKPATLLGDTQFMPSTFGADRAGRLYVGDYRGKIWRIVK